jgi:hypothetical protein
MNMLLIHHQVVNGERGWARTSSILTALQHEGILFQQNPLAIFIAYQIILAVFDHRDRVHRGLNIDWLQKAGAS